MSYTKIIPIDNVDSGIKECIISANTLLDISKTLHEKSADIQSIGIFYYALSEFGKAVLLRDKKRLAEYKNQSQIDVSDFFNDNYKKIDAAMRTAGPNVEIIKFDKFGIHGIIDLLEIKNGISETNIDNLMLIDFDPNNAKWEQRLTNKLQDLQNDAFTVLSKMLKKWQTFY